MELLSPATERITFFVAMGLSVWLVLVLVQDNTDDTLKVTILEQKPFP